MNNVILSVIVPVYNAESYLQECLDSVYSQGVERLEVICINDGSTDNSRYVLEEYQKKQEDLLIINKENEGLAAARNSGFKVAKGKYIYYLDNDDYLLPNTLGKMIRLADEDNLDLASFNAYIGKNLFYYTKKIHINEVMAGKDFYPENYRLNGFFPPALIWMHLYRKSFLEENGLAFREGLNIEDEHFTPRAFFLAQRVKHFNIPIVFHRTNRTESINNEHLNSFNDSYIHDLMITGEDLYTFFNSQNDIDKIFYHKVFQIYFSMAVKIAIHNPERKKVFFNNVHYKNMRAAALTWEWYLYYWLFRYFTGMFRWYTSNESNMFLKKIINRFFRIYFLLIGKINLV